MLGKSLDTLSSLCKTNTQITISHEPKTNLKTTPKEYPIPMMYLSQQKIERDRETLKAL